MEFLFCADGRESSFRRLPSGDKRRDQVARVGAGEQITGECPAAPPPAHHIGPWQHAIMADDTVGFCNVRAAVANSIRAPAKPPQPIKLPGEYCFEQSEKLEWKSKQVRLCTLAHPPPPCFGMHPGAHGCFEQGPFNTIHHATKFRKALPADKLSVSRSAICHDVDQMNMS